MFSSDLTLCVRAYIITITHLWHLHIWDSCYSKREMYNNGILAAKQKTPIDEEYARFIFSICDKSL